MLGRLLRATLGPFRHLQRARKLVRAGDFEAATEEYARVWQTRSPVIAAMIAGVKYTYVVDDLGKLFEKFPPARQRFAAVRDSVAPGSSHHDALDFVSLNRALGDEEMTLAWFDQWTEMPAPGSELYDVGHLLIVHALAVRGRWADIGRFYADPIGSLRWARTTSCPRIVALASTEAEVKANEEQFRWSVRAMVYGLRAAGRPQAAEDALAEAKRLDPSPEMAAALSGKS